MVATTAQLKISPFFYLCMVWSPHLCFKKKNSCDASVSFFSSGYYICCWKGDIFHVQLWQPLFTSLLMASQCPVADPGQQSGSPLLCCLFPPGWTLPLSLCPDLAKQPWKGIPGHCELCLGQQWITSFLKFSGWCFWLWLSIPFLGECFWLIFKSWRQMGCLQLVLGQGFQTRFYWGPY